MQSFTGWMPFLAPTSRIHFFCILDNSLKDMGQHSLWHWLSVSTLILLKIINNYKCAQQSASTLLG